MNLTLKQKAKWIAALRSGKYQQGTGLLRRLYGQPWDNQQETFCCLGVLAAVCPSIRRRVCNASYLKDKYGKPVALPEEIQQALALLNDQRVPFEVIAGLIKSAL